jgi:hypothetical protein
MAHSAALLVLIARPLSLLLVKAFRGMYFFLVKTGLVGGSSAGERGQSPDQRGSGLRSSSLSPWLWLARPPRAVSAQ